MIMTNGKGPQAAKGQLATTVVLDTRTTRRRVVLYAEGDTGTIYRATGTAFTDPTLKRAGQGVRALIHVVRIDEAAVIVRARAWQQRLQ